MIQFGGEKIKPVDPKFEEAKKTQQHENKMTIHKELAIKFSELIKEEPIVIYTQHDGFKPEKNEIYFNNVNEIRNDETGTGGSIEVLFSYDDWVAVGTNGCRGSSYFDKNNDYYKITQESADSVIRMMNELIERSGYSSIEKTKMSQDVFNNFKNKIVKQEDLEKVEK